MKLPPVVTEVFLGGIWFASAVKVFGYTWDSVKSTWSSLPGPGGGGGGGGNTGGLPGGGLPGAIRKSPPPLIIPLPGGGEIPVPGNLPSKIVNGIKGVLGIG